MPVHSETPVVRAFHVLNGVLLIDIQITEGPPPPRILQFFLEN